MQNVMKNRLSIDDYIETRLKFDVVAMVKIINDTYLVHVSYHNKEILSKYGHYVSESNY